jgi:drug/metabolite transporter (DMT)-like permease
MIGEFAALGAAISWAVAPILYRKALSKSTPVSANIVRCVTNAAVLTLILVVIGGVGALARLPLEVWVIVSVSGAIGLGVGDTLYMIGLKSVGVAKAVPLAATYPLFSLLWTVVLLGKPVALPALLGASIILIGIWLLSRDRRGVNDATARGSFKGVVASLATAVVWSVSVTLMGVAVTLSGSSSLDVNFAILVLRLAPLSVFLLVFSPLLDRDRGFLKMNRNTLILLCVGGLVANGVGWLLMNISFLTTVESQAIPISSTTPLFSALAGFALFHEKATRENVLGAIAVAAGVALIFII